MTTQLLLLASPDRLAFFRNVNGRQRPVEGPTETQAKQLAMPARFERSYLAGLVIFEPGRYSYVARRWNEPPLPLERDSLRALTLQEYDDWITDPRLQTMTLNELWPRVDLENSRRDRLTEIVVALAQEVA